MGSFRIEERSINPEEYLGLRATTNWLPVSREQAVIALSNDLFSVCVLHNRELVGIGRLIGDGAVYYYIQDIIVKPEYQDRGIGSRIMESLENYLIKNAPAGSFVGLMAAEDTEGFYKQYGYEKRASNRPGMFKYIH